MRPPVSCPGPTRFSPPFNFSKAVWRRSRSICICDTHPELSATHSQPIGYTDLTTYPQLVGCCRKRYSGAADPYMYDRSCDSLLALGNTVSARRIQSSRQRTLRSSGAMRKQIVDTHHHILHPAPSCNRSRHRPRVGSQQAKFP